jgi:hypothetical protein
MNQLQTRIMVFAVGLALSGCAAPPPKQEEPKYTPPLFQTPAPPPPPEPAPPPQPVVVPVEPSHSELSLAEAVGHFERGEYTMAMKKLTPLTTDPALDVPGQLKALKTLAFSQCLTRAVVSCRKTFERAFKLDPAFDLAAAEQGHPIWGKQFLNARKNLKIK